jgi:hypothetical protein
MFLEIICMANTSYSDNLNYEFGTAPIKQIC